ncbi:MAG: FKBP-type peptidyl-prolyl cis-trans isomerase [Steroidobacteraceae bacterium]
MISIRIPRALAACALSAGLALAAVASAQSPPSAPPPPSQAVPAAASDADPGYLFGLTLGEQMHAVGISTQVNPESITRGVKDGLNGKKSTRADQQQIQKFVQSLMAEELARNQRAAKEFLAKNAHEKGVKSTPDGLQYKVLAAGSAKAPGVLVTDEVTVQYRGKLLDGTEFDSSYTRGTPATFKLSGVIKGWQEGLALMKPGAKWQLFIPPELAYGDSQRPGIPAGSLLIFDVELMSVKSAPPQESPTVSPSHKVTPPLKSADPGAAPTTAP